MIKKFLEEHHHLKLAIQHLGIHGGGFMVQVYNTTWDYTCSEPIFEHFVTDFDLANLNVNFETAIITPVISWWDDVNKKQKGEQSMAKICKKCQCYQCEKNEFCLKCQMCHFESEFVDETESDCINREIEQKGE